MVLMHVTWETQSKMQNQQDYRHSGIIPFSYRADEFGVVTRFGGNGCGFNATACPGAGLRIAPARVLGGNG